MSAALLQRNERSVERRSLFVDHTCALALKTIESNASLLKIIENDCLHCTEKSAFFLYFSFRVAFIKDERINQAPMLKSIFGLIIRNAFH